MHSPEYKALQQEFISNLNGTSIPEISTVLQVLPMSLWTYAEVFVFIQIITFYLNSNRSKVDPEHLNAAFLFLLEFGVLIVPNLIAFTVASYTWSMVWGMTALSFGLSLVNRQLIQPELREKYDKLRVQDLATKQVSLLTCFRSEMMLATCIAILAVDFTIFPRRFAKTETFGTSIMDIGVGAFIVSSGITSRYARMSPCLTESHSSWLLKLVQRLSIIIVLGLIRLATVKGIDYTEHASEYGVHWNFYFTIASVQFSFEVLHRFHGNMISAAGAAVIIVGYQLLLTFGGLENYILTAPRLNFFSQNREGLCSWMGYVSLYVFAACIGRELIFKRTVPKFTGNILHGLELFKKSYRLRIGFFFGLQTFGWVITWIGTFLFKDPSRRMVNLPYVAWILSQSTLLLLMVTLVQYMSLRPVLPQLYAAVSTRQLFVFLIANLMTGLVNISMETIIAPPGVGFAVLLTYMLGVTLVPYIMFRYQVSILRF